MISGILISDFTIDNLSNYINNLSSPYKIQTSISPFNQVHQVLMDQSLNCWDCDYDFALIWTLPDRIIKNYSALLEFRQPSLKSILNEVEEFAQNITNIFNRVKFVLIPSWPLLTPNRELGLLNLKPGLGFKYILMEMNIRMAQILGKYENCFLLDSNPWLFSATSQVYNPKLWYIGKIPFGNSVFLEAAKEIHRTINAIRGKRKKLLLVDLDNTLWGGIVGDCGWENIILGGHDPLGEAYIDFQKALKILSRRGIILGIISKNEEKVALETITKHPEMILTLDDFAGWRINWNDKAQNIVELVKEINIGLDSVVFIDDNPYERARIEDTLPEVFVPEFPKNPMALKNFLLNLECFDTPSISIEDKERTQMYVTERKRREKKQAIPSLDTWLHELNITVKAETLSKNNLSRTIQLFNKTNQMNLTTRRLTESELIAWTQIKTTQLWTFSVADKFGNLGLTGIISLYYENTNGIIQDFILSCRVMGRGIEQTMLHVAIDFSRKIGLHKVQAKYIPTKKNKPCLHFFNNSGFKHTDFLYSWDVTKPYNLPGYVSLSITT